VSRQTRSCKWNRKKRPAASQARVISRRSCLLIFSKLAFLSKLSTARSRSLARRFDDSGCFYRLLSSGRSESCSHLVSRSSPRWSVFSRRSRGVVGTMDMKIVPVVINAIIPTDTAARKMLTRTCAGIEEIRPSRLSRRTHAACKRERAGATRIASRIAFLRIIPKLLSRR